MQSEALKWTAKGCAVHSPRCTLCVCNFLSLLTLCHLWNPVIPKGPALEVTVSFNAQVMMPTLPMPSLGSRESQPWLVSCFHSFWGTPRRAKMSHKFVWLSDVSLSPCCCPVLSAGHALSPGRGLSGPYPLHPKYGLDCGLTVQLIPGCAF